MLNRAERQNCPSVPHAEATGIGQELYDLIAELYPICRSITGNGVRETLRVIAQRIPLEVREIPSGTDVFDWTVPKEWNIRDAYVKDSGGRKIIDFKNSNLHVLNYSSAIHKTISLSELRQHLFTLPQYPDWIPYRTSYYQENWGFCLTQKQYESLGEDEYEVVIESSLEDGYLTLGECYLEGEMKDEILVSTHVCHPSLCNDNLSGVAVATFLAHALLQQKRRYSYRFLFVPGTIGPITWLALNEDRIEKIRHGLVVACVGDRGSMTYKQSRMGNAEIDKAVEHVLRHSGEHYEILRFSPYGYDERQYCSPGFNLPVGCLMRTPHGRYPQYHTSADDLDFVRPECLADSFNKYWLVCNILENNKTFQNRNPKCEPQLGKRGLYGPIGGQSDAREAELAMLWVLNLSDGQHTLLDIAERAAMRFEMINHAAERLYQHGLLIEK
jgi:aminopeptidase-like protein